MRNHYKLKKKQRILLTGGICFLFFLLSKNQIIFKQTGWIQKGEDIYYIDESGKEVTGLYEIDGNVYKFDEQGKADMYDVEMNVDELNKINDSKTNNLNSKSEFVEPSIDTNWWQELTDEQIKEKLIQSLVWYNEVTNEYYYGTQNISYGWNEDHIIFGGLILKENPYGIEFLTDFIGGIENIIATNKHSMWWSAPDYSRQIILDDLVIEDGQSITFEQRLAMYGK